MTHGRPRHDLPHTPQFSGSEAIVDSQPFKGFKSQLPKPALQVEPQTSAAHVATAFAGMGQTTPHTPQFSGSEASVASQPFKGFKSQLPKPALQVEPHTSAAHVATAFAGTGQIAQAGPHAVGSVGTTHLSPHFTGAAGVHPFVHWNEGPAGAQSGAAAVHAVPHAPQVSALERSLSHPSAPFALQSARPGLHALTTHFPPWQPIELYGEGHAEQLGFPQP